MIYHNRRCIEATWNLSLKRFSPPKIIILRYCNPEDLKMQDTLLNKNTKPIRVTT